MRAGNSEIESTTRPRRIVTQQKLEGRLAAALRSELGDDAFGLDGKLLDWRDALVPIAVEALDRRDPAPVFDPSRRRVPESGATMALNSFLPWLAHLNQLCLVGGEGFERATFDARCPTGVRGTPPHLDVLAMRDQNVVAVTARGADYLARRQGSLAPAYADVAVNQALEPWIDLSRRIRTRQQSFRYLDVGAMMKFALGLERTFPGHRLDILYLYWEPRGVASFEPFARHRQELTTLVDVARGSAVRFHATSFAELWRSWLELGDLPWLRALVAQLERRYDVAMDDLLVL
ncbi:MAG: hypothetical protein KDE35_05945 [Geminicoccaceae bacterium]|nr:hypothetical protein [Geminicoccaceae bacterium]